MIQTARVSFDKESDRATNPDGTHAGSSNELTTADTRFIKYLATHGHWTPRYHACGFATPQSGGTLYPLYRNTNAHQWERQSCTGEKLTMYQSAKSQLCTVRKVIYVKYEKLAVYEKLEMYPKSYLCMNPT